ncbi:MAG: 3-deoxy-manno-octulosonate cytidylyltransferase [Pseudomonadota bacterium]
MPHNPPPSYRIVIPARYGSQRLPGKPLLPVAGQPLIWHMYQAAQRSAAREVVIATDDARIADAARNFGAHVCLTRADHPSGTDRIAEVAAQCDWAHEDIIVNLQGDEPDMPPALLDQVACELAAHPTATLSTLAVPIDQAAEHTDPSVVKVVTDQAGMALYFSRAPIPWQRDTDATMPPPRLRHLGIYAYRVSFLHRYATWPDSPLEQVESLEQLRALWHGEPIRVGIASETPPPGIDTADDYARLLASRSGATTCTS